MQKITTIEQLKTHILSKRQNTIGCFLKVNKKSIIVITVNRSFNPDLKWCYSVSTHKWYLSDTRDGYSISHHSFCKDVKTYPEALELAKSQTNEKFEDITVYGQEESEAAYQAKIAEQKRVQSVKTYIRNSISPLPVIRPICKNTISS